MDIADTVRVQRAFFAAGHTRSIAFRLEQLLRLQQTLRNHEAQLHQALWEDFRKSPFENHLNDLGMVYKEIQDALTHLPRWVRHKRVRTNWVNQPGKSFIVPEPLGTALVIGAWNYPLQLTLSPAVAALAAGNTVVLKPSELPAQTSRLLATLLNTAFDPGLLKVVEGGVPASTELLAQPFDKIFFTGSAQVGKVVYQAAAKLLTPVTLELGGKSPAIVAADADLSVCARRLVWAKFLNAGQTCVAPDYVLVQNSVKEKFLEHVIAAIRKANYSVENGNYVQIIHARHFQRLQALLDGANVYYGGHCDAEARIIAPTILYPAGPGDAAMQEEIFGPVLPVIPYESWSEVVDIVRMHPRPLACYLFSESRAIQQRLIREISFGGGAINDAMMHLVNENLPFGGVGSSGMGAYHGEYGFREFSHWKSILQRSTWLEPPLKYFPYRPWKLRWIRWLMGDR